MKENRNIKSNSIPATKGFSCKIKNVFEILAKNRRFDRAKTRKIF